MPPSIACSDPLCKDAIHSQERDSYVLDVMSNLIEVSHLTIPMTGGGKVKPEAPKSCPVTKNIPGWELEVLPYKEDAVFWHSIWVSAGRPTLGVLRDLMARTRNRYHYAIRRCKKMSESIRARRLLEASALGSVNLFMELKKIKGSDKSGGSLTDIVAGPQVKQL